MSQPEAAAFAGIHAFVINLASASERRRLMTAQLDQPHLPTYTLLDAVDGRVLPAAALAQGYDEAAARRDAHRSLSAGEIGCALSHRAAWQAVLDRGLTAGLVLEDDAVLGSESGAVIARLKPLLDVAEPRVVLVQHVPRYRGLPVAKLSRLHRLYRPWKTRGAHAYLINRAAAQALLQAMPRVSVVADDWPHFARWVEVLAVVPYGIGRSPASHDSQIGPAGRREAGGSALGRWLYKRLYEKFLFQLVVRPLRLIRAQAETW